MKRFIQKLLNPTLEQGNEEKNELSVELTTAIFMIEVSKADFHQDEEELAHIRHLLQAHLMLGHDDIDELLENAHQEADRLVSLQHLTRYMNEKMTQQEKVRVIELMWKVAYADGEKDHYEEHLLRQVADLLYVSHADFIQARHQAEESV